MRGQEIIISAEPRGRFDEGTIEGALYPGTCVEIKPSVDPSAGRPTYRQVSRADGAIGPVAVLLPMDAGGQLSTSPYTSGDRCRVYYPIAGDDLNMVIRSSSGTGTAGETNVGDKLAIQKGSGKLMPGGALTSQPFMLMEHVGLDTAADLAWVKYLGNQA